MVTESNLPANFVISHQLKILIKLSLPLQNVLALQFYKEDYYGR